MGAPQQRVGKRCGYSPLPCAMGKVTQGRWSGIKYDPRNTVELLFAWRGTVWPTLLCRPLLWTCVIVYVAGVVCKYAYNVNLPLIEEKVLHVTGGLLTFFVVFFTVECYQRFRFGFDKVKQSGGAIRNMVVLLTSEFPDDVHLQREVLRLMVLAQHVSFAHVGSQQFQKIGKDDENEDFFSLEHAEHAGLATAKERMILQQFIDANGTAEQYVLPLRWCHNLITKKKHEVGDGVMRSMNDFVCDCRAGLSALVGMTETQIPLSFFHLLNFTMNIYVTLFSYSLVFVPTWFCWVTMIMYTVAMLGLREVSIILAEPFGDDDSDISLQKMLVGGFKVCARILTSPDAESDFAQAEECWQHVLKECKVDPASLAAKDKMGDPIVPAAGAAATETSHLMGDTAGTGDAAGSASGSGNGYGSGMLQTGQRTDYRYL